MTVSRDIRRARRHEWCNEQERYLQRRRILDSEIVRAEVGVTVSREVELGSDDDGIDEDAENGGVAEYDVGYEMMHSTSANLASGLRREGEGAEAGDRDTEIAMIRNCDEIGRKDIEEG